LIPENDNHTILKENTPAQLQLIANNKMTYRISCKGKPSPCKISIRYLHLAKGVTPDLQVFVSMTEISPSAVKCDQKHAGPHSIIVNATDKKTSFKHAYNIYLAFLSQQGLSIKVTVNFIDIHEHRKKKRDDEYKEREPVQFDFDDNPHDDPFFEIKQ